MKTPRGIRQVNEDLLQKGRALIITDEDFNNYDWNQLPNGTLHVDGKTGMISVKLEGETTWVPSNLADKSLIIARDTQLAEETFKVITTDNGDNTFTYETNGERRHKPILNNGESYVFELEDGTYLEGRNHLTVIIDGILTRTVASGTIKELSETRFAISEKLVENQEIMVRYVKWARVGNPWPRIFLSEEQPDTAGVGDFWLKQNGNFEEDGFDDDLNNYNPSNVSWSRIVDKPTTLNGYGVIDEVALKEHEHMVSDIRDFPLSMPANGGDAETIMGRTLVDSGSPNYTNIEKAIVVLEGNTVEKKGKINENYIPNINANKIYGVLSKDNLPSFSSDLINDVISVSKLPDIPADIIKGELAVSNLPAVPTSKLDGTILIANLPNIPTTKLSGKIQSENMPNVPTTLLTGKVATENLPNIDPSLLKQVPIENFTSIPLPLTHIPSIPTSKLSDIYVQTNRPSSPKEGVIWFCTSSSPHIEVYSGNKWITF